MNKNIYVDSLKVQIQKEREIYENKDSLLSVSKTVQNNTGNGKPQSKENPTANCDVALSVFSSVLFLNTTKIFSSLCFLYIAFNQAQLFLL